MTEWNLSEKQTCTGVHDFSGGGVKRIDIYREKDVREFIRRLKALIADTLIAKLQRPTAVKDTSLLLKKIHKLAGEKLCT